MCVGHSVSEQLAVHWGVHLFAFCFVVPPLIAIVVLIIVVSSAVILHPVITLIAFVVVIRLLENTVLDRNAAPVPGPLQPPEVQQLEQPPCANTTMAAES